MESELAAGSVVVIGTGVSAEGLMNTARSAGFAVAPLPMSPAAARKGAIAANTRMGLIAAEGMGLEELSEVAWHWVTSGTPVWIDGPAVGALRGLVPAHPIGGRRGVVLARPRPLGVLARVIDVAVGLGALALLSPVLLVLAALVKGSSPGPVLHRAVVVGQDGQPFTWYKLRTMRLAKRNSDEDHRRREQFQRFLEAGDGPTKIVDASRITPIGRFLRRHSLDELPQLFSLFKGDLTLIGPRPCLVYEYEVLQPWQRRRFAVLPGLTGLWQVRGRGVVHGNEMAFMDVAYALGRTWRSDARILWETIKIVISGRGAE